MRLKIIASVALILSSGLPGHAMAHAHLAGATPQPNGTVKTGPQAVTLDFTEDLEGKLSSIAVTDSTGARVDDADCRLDPKDARRMVVDLKPLQPGTYTVTWTATATDTHKTHGSFAFTVAPQ